METTRWIKCRKCGHKLFNVVTGGTGVVLETKCHSCKEIQTVVLLGGHNGNSKPESKG